MSKKLSYAADLLGLSRLTVSAVAGVAEMAEALHLTVLRQVGTPLAKPLARATSLVYRGVRGVTGLVGGGIDAALARLQPWLGEHSGWAGRDALLAAVNGVLGDYLARTGNGLALPMAFRRGGATLVLRRDALQQAIPAATGRILVLAHGLCMHDAQWLRGGHDHGAALQRERAYTAVYLRYNSGLHISSNGRAFAAALQQLLDNWPVPVRELVIVGHSMGGLVARSACRYGAEAGHGWLAHLSKMVFLGSPHQGAPLERGGNWFHVISDMSPYTAPFSRLGKIRSAGITDLRHGSVLDEDWNGKDRFAHGAPLPQGLPLPAAVQCYAVAATMGKAEGDLGDRLAGDGLVPLASALGRHAEARRQLDFPPARQLVVRRTSHLGLLDSPAVYRALLAWL
ncbi:esterase/lipase family protein [Janthinobacterium fluminis]|uniref:Alpha/beta hydrolase n=1 Tax=Janthinobacterium fluminis TaxID=2987524 RepID=A0ABT5JYW7_9BURK|nr:alpha/beta hydrolase [Janthinobacterium fluminis]MDC8757784.1 alpha/beta hydrolase [Janthinobacterium fluminis]